MSDTRVTALMPLKNYHSEYLRRAVQSIINQTCPHWRLTIIVEKEDLNKFNGILENYLNDSRIQIIVNQGRKLAGAINTGMKLAQTDFVAIILSDDMWANNAVEVLGYYIAQFPDVEFFHSSRIIVDENDRPVSPIYLSREQFSVDDFKLRSPVKHLLCWRKDKALSVGGLDESLNSVGPDDYDFPWTMAEHGATFKAVKECLYIYRDHRDCFRLTTHLPLSVHKTELKRIFRKHGVDASTTREKIARAEKTYLRQCLYRSKFDRWIKEFLGCNAKQGWREIYKKRV